MRNWFVRASWNEISVLRLISRMQGLAAMLFIYLLIYFNLNSLLKAGETPKNISSPTRCYPGEAATILFIYMWLLNMLVEQDQMVQMYNGLH